MRKAQSLLRRMKARCNALRLLYPTCFTRVLPVDRMFQFYKDCMQEQAEIIEANPISSRSITRWFCASVAAVLGKGKKDRGTGKGMQGIFQYTLGGALGNWNGLSLSTGLEGSITTGNAVVTSVQFMECGCTK